MNFKKIGLSTAVVLFAWSCFAEDSISLDDIEEVDVPSKAYSTASGHGAGAPLHFFGKMDLTTDFSPYEKKEVTSNGSFETQHFLLFFKAKSGKDIQVQAEIIDKSFYYVNYKLSAHSRLLFGKIMVPFGETDHYHHLYGGNANRNGSGIMLPNIWAEKGMNFQTQFDFKNSELDVYWVSGVTSVDGQGNPVLNLPSDNTQQAGGVRYSLSPTAFLKTRLSYYYNDIGPDLDIHGAGIDLFGSWNSKMGPVRSVDLALGVAKFDIQKKKDTNFYKQGDFASLQFHFPNKTKLRLRYGTYDDNNRTETAEDSKSWSVAVLKRVKSMLLMAEHQWNLEQVNEVDNDVLRFMASVEF